MSDRVAEVLIEDMLRAMERSLDYVDGFTYSAFLADTRTFDAVLRNLEVLGEAAAPLPVDGRQPRERGREVRTIAGASAMGRWAKGLHPGSSIISFVFRRHRG